MIKLSVVIITLNEEKNIGRCISSVKEIADEIVVVDSFSSDRTQQICEENKVIFIQNAFKGHIEQKNFALGKANFDYILSLDADEALSIDLINEIKKIKNNFNLDGYSFNRLTNYAGHWVKYCGWYPDTKLRLIKKGAAIWSGTNPHDILKANTNKIGFIKGDLLHYSYESISSHINQTNKFTTISAEAMFKNGERSSLFKIFTRPVFKFFKDYFLELGILDGRYGFIICFINSLSALLKYSKLYDLQIGKNIK